MKFCTNCGNPVDGNLKFCPNCGCSLQQTDSNNAAPNDRDVHSTENTFVPLQQVSNSNNPPQSVTTPRKKHAALSIIAFILSFTLFLSPVAVILAIIDLFVNKGRKHGLSIAALIIGGLLSILLITTISQSSDTSSSGTVITATDGQSSDAEVKKDNTEKKATQKATSAPTSAAESKEAFISSCITVAYQDVERSPDSFSGKRIRIEGTVIQVSEGWFDSVTYRIATDARGHDDIWLVTYTRPADEARILEDDHVVVYGVCNGVETYESVLGASVTIPAMKAKYIDIASKSAPKYSTNILKFDVAKKTYNDNYEYHAIVEIKNTGDSSIYIKDAVFDLEDQTGHLLQTDEYGISLYRTIIKPGEVGYLYTNYAFDIKDSSNLDNLVLKPHFTAQSTYVVLDQYSVSDTSLSNDRYSGISVTGRVTNNTSKDASYVYVRVAYYDADGKVLGVTGTSVTGLDAGKTVSFEITGYAMNSDFSIDEVATYEILAEETYYGF